MGDRWTCVCMFGVLMRDSNVRGKLSWPFENELPAKALARGFICSKRSVFICAFGFEKISFGLFCIINVFILRKVCLFI